MNMGDVLGLVRVVAAIRAVRSLDGSAGEKGCRVERPPVAKIILLRIIVVLEARDNRII